MNLFNRILIISVTLMVMAISILVCLQIFEIFSFEKVGLSLPLRDWWQTYPGGDLQTRLIFGGFLLGVFFLCAILLFFELHSIIVKDKYFLVSSDSLGKVEISEQSINSFINHEANQFAMVEQSQTTIVEKNDGFYIKSLVTIKPAVSISEIGKVLQTNIKTSMQEKLGLYVSEVVIKTRLQKKQKENDKIKNEKVQRKLN